MKRGKNVGRLNQALYRLHQTLSFYSYLIVNNLLFVGAFYE